MAYKDANGFDHATGETQTTDVQTLQISGNTVDLPNESYVRDADISHDGADLVLSGPDGTIIVESYFSGAESPALVAPSGATLTPELVNSFATSGDEYAQTASFNDASPIGAVQEISGNATITRGDGSTQELSIGSPVYQGDVIETNSGSAVNVAFVDESSFAVSEETRLAIDEYVFDPSSQGGVQNFSVLKGVFVYTSGLIGREDPDDVSIETPVGSIGIRGTIIAGDVNAGEITVVEGAIVLRTPGGEEMTLASQFETGRFTSNNGIQNIGQKSANDVVEKFSIVSNVAPNLFSSINDAAAENAAQAPDAPDKPAQEPVVESAPEAQEFDADGATDQDGDSEVDGTVEDAGTSDGDGAALDTNTADEAVDTASDAQEMNPMAMQIAQAMGMMSGSNGAPMMGMGGDSQGMGNMATMAMTTDDALMNGETMMENIMEAEGAMDKANLIDAQLDNIRDFVLDQNIINPDLIKKAILLGDTPVNFKDAGIGIDFQSIAPDAFFASGEDYAWNYQFSNEFSGTATSFELSAATRSTLNDLKANGIIETNGISFNNANGALNLDFTDDFGTFIADGSSLQIDIEIAATNANGTSGFSTYDFDIYNDSAGATPTLGWTAPTSDISSTIGGEVFNSPSGISSTLTTIGVSEPTDGIKVFFGDLNDRAEIGSGNAVTNSTINLGSGNNTVTTSSGSGSVNNTIIGGNDSDTFTIREVENYFHGLGGDDTFKIDISGSSEAIVKLNTASSDILIDGGTSEFRALNSLNSPAPATGGRGDTLELTGTGAIDFTTVNDSFIKGIERLELGLGNQTVTLSYEDVVQMTDANNTLLIRADADDTVNFTDFTSRGFTLSSTETIDDNAVYTSVNADDTDFDVYTDGNVTLLVEQGVAAPAEFA